MRGLFVTGTDTGVGKTWVGATLARLLSQRGVSVRPRKPVESGCHRSEEGLLPWDAEVLFGRRAPLEVEVGSGKGLFLRSAAVERPEVDFLGIEIGPKYARFAAAGLAKRAIPNAVVAIAALGVELEALSPQSSSILIVLAVLTGVIAPIAFRWLSAGEHQDTSSATMAAGAQLILPARGPHARPRPPRSPR